MSKTVSHSVEATGPKSRRAVYEYNCLSKVIATPLHRALAAIRPLAISSVNVPIYMPV
jgi:hypothetical protein